MGKQTKNGLTSLPSFIIHWFILASQFPLIFLWIKWYHHQQQPQNKPQHCLLFIIKQQIGPATTKMPLHIITRSYQNSWFPSPTLFRVLAFLQKNWKRNASKTKKGTDKQTEEETDKLLGKGWEMKKWQIFIALFYIPIKNGLQLHICNTHANNIKVCSFSHSVPNGQLYYAWLSASSEKNFLQLDVYTRCRHIFSRVW